MPGLVGVIGNRSSTESASRFQAACRRMCRYPGMVVESAVAANGQWHMGRVRLTRGRASDTAGASPFAFVHGEIDNLPSVTAALQKTSAHAASVERAVKELYQQSGADFVGLLDGAFCLSVADEDHRIALLAADLCGNYPLYWSVDDEGLVYGSDLSAVILARRARVRIDLRAVADYLTLGAVLEDRTLAEGIHLLDPGTVLVFNAGTGKVTLRRFAAIEELFAPKATDRSDYMSAVPRTFKAAVARSVDGAAPIGLSLSGGLDSRAILSALNGSTGSVRTYTLGVDGCADHVIGDRLAALAGTKHAFFELHAGYLRDFLPNLAAMVSATDGMYLSHGLTEMLAVEFIDTMGVSRLLRGHGGELAKAHLAWPLHTDANVYQLADLDRLAAYLSARANYVTPHLRLETLLTPEAAAVAGAGSADSFRAVLRGTALSSAEACSYLYLRELNRRFTIPSLELFRTRVDVRMPFVDREFLRVLLAAPPEWRDSTEIHKALTLAGLPSLARVRNSNTGAPASAGPLTETVLDKFNTLFKRMNLRGFRHYHNFDGWMRNMLLESVEAELLPSSARIHAFVRQDVVRTLIEETRQGRGAHAYLLQVLLILELWQRENGVEAAAASDLL